MCDNMMSAILRTVGGNGLKLDELSAQYRDQYNALQERIAYLNVLCISQTDEQELDMLGHRIRMLTAMKKEAGQLAVLKERYYERGYRRNEEYSF